MHSCENNNKVYIFRIAKSRSETRPTLFETQLIIKILWEVAHSRYMSHEFVESLGNVFFALFLPEMYLNLSSAIA